MPVLPPVALLLADVNAQTRDYAVRVLREAGYAVLTADAATVLEALQGDGIEALIVLDAASGSTSEALAQQAKALHRGLKVAVVPWLLDAAQTVAPAKAADWLLRDLHAPATPSADVSARPMKAS